MREIVIVILSLMVLVFVGLFVVRVVGGLWFQYTKEINSFEECLRAGYPVMESYPRQCRAGDKLFVEEIAEEEFVSENVRVETPKMNQSVLSPLRIEGEARGLWFFEASFPVKVLDEDGSELGAHYVQAQSDWMTTDFVPFAGEVVFDTPRGEYGTFVLEKDNPSGLPEHADEVRVPIRFALFDPEAEGSSTDGCKRTGCSGQICSDEDVVTTCEFRPEYACYQAAVCERQLNGECGWTETEDLTQCLRGI